MITSRCFGNTIDAPLWEAGDVHCGRSLPPGGERFFEVQVERVGEHLQAILDLEESTVSENLYKAVAIQ